MRIHIWQNLMCVTYLMVLKRMEEFFRRNGCELVDDAAAADWTVIGACGAFYGQIDTFFEKLDEFAQLPGQVAVYGCLPRIATERYAAARSKVALTTDARRPERVEQILGDHPVPWRDVPEAAGFRDQDYRHFDPRKRYLVVQEGCDATCTFCPHIRGIGPARSVPRERLLCQVRGFVEQGMESLLLEGRDIGSWGRDLTPGGTIGELLSEIAAVQGDFRIFVNQLGGNWVVRYGDELLGPLRHPKIADVHIPIQTVNDRVLELMGREKGIRKLAPLLEKLGRGQARRVLRTDMLVGFPTETEEEFEENLAFILEHFDEVAVYGFELHPFTRVAAMDVRPHSQATIQARVARALEAIRNAPAMVWHQGGQVPDTMLDRERHKAELGRG